MDSLTQIVFGASVAGACAPAGHRRKAIAVGAALGTLPDLDVLIDYGDAVSNFTYHRGFSHSLFVLPPFAIALWALLRKTWEPVRSAPTPWLFAILLALVTHPLLDAHTAYGTQIWWPLQPNPTSWSTLFIIDPLFTLPLLAGVVTATVLAKKQAAQKALVAGLVACTLYLSWSWIAKLSFEHRLVAQLDRDGVDYDAVFSTPSPFNTLLWRAVVLTDEGYLEGYYSFIADERVHLNRVDFDRQLLEDASWLADVERLRWFSRDFVSAAVIDDELVIADLRMGQYPTYVFNHVVAEASNPQWKPVSSRQLEVSFEARQLGTVWTALWEGSDVLTSTPSQP